jgi:uncharacterized protein YdeI (YjbR/CyaY-like superfamily)
VLATFDGVAYRGSVVRRGGHPLIGVRKEIRSSIAKGPGDRVTVTLERDEDVRVVDLPFELASALETNKAARSAFQALSFTHQREHALYVSAAKQEETRRRRAQRTLDSLL